MEKLAKKYNLRAEIAKAFSSRSTVNQHKFDFLPAYWRHFAAKEEARQWMISALHSPGPVSLRLASGDLSEYLVCTELRFLEARMDQPTLIPGKSLEISELERFRNAPFENMIKFVVDVRLKRIALGGEMHADAEEALLRAGSDQADLWGGNLWPWDRPPRIEYISLINIRPSVNNRGMEILLDHVRILVRDIVHEWVNLQ